MQHCRLFQHFLGVLSYRAFRAGRPLRVMSQCEYARHVVATYERELGSKLRLCDIPGLTQHEAEEMCGEGAEGSCGGHLPATI